MDCFVSGGAIFGATDVVITRSLTREQYLKVTTFLVGLKFKTPRKIIEF
jgi:hypothetical protein